MNKKIKQHLDYILSQYEVEYLGIFLFGSQNYGLDFEGSDVDTRFIYFPNQEEIILNSTLIEFGDEYIEMVDVRTFLFGLDNGVLPTLECLLTKYYIINPKYQELWLELKNKTAQIITNGRNKIVEYIPYFANIQLEYFLTSTGEKYNSFFPTKSTIHLLRTEEILDKVINLKDPLTIFDSNLQKVCYNLKFNKQDYREIQSLVFQTYTNILLKSERFLMLNRGTNEDFWKYQIYPIVEEILKPYLNK